MFDLGVKVSPYFISERKTQNFLFILMWVGVTGNELLNCWKSWRKESLPLWNFLPAYQISGWVELSLIPAYSQRSFPDTDTCIKTRRQFSWNSLVKNPHERLEKAFTPVREKTVWRSLIACWGKELNCQERGWESCSTIKILRPNPATTVHYKTPTNVHNAKQHTTQPAISNSIRKEEERGRRRSKLHYITLPIPPKEDEQRSSAVLTKREMMRKTKMCRL